MHTKQLFFLALCLGIFGASAQTVSTFTEGTPDDAIILDNVGNIYCSNYMGDTVFRFSPVGDLTTFVTGLNTPNGLAFNASGEFFVCDGQGNTIYKYDEDGNLITSFPIAGHPSGIIKSRTDDSLIFTLYTGNKIHRLDPDGTISLISEAPELNGPVGLAYDDNGDLYVGNYNNRKIYRVLANGDLDYVATVGGASTLGFIAYGGGMLWGTIMGEHKIYTINPNGIDDVTLFAGSTIGSMDGDISEATFNQPNGIYVDEPNNTIYITDFGSKNLRIISEVPLGNDEFYKAPNFISVVPNPVGDSFHVHLSLDIEEKFELRLFDSLGKKVYTEANLTSKDSIDASHLKNGWYLLEVIVGKNIFRTKLLK